MLVLRIGEGGGIPILVGGEGTTEILHINILILDS